MKDLAKALYVFIPPSSLQLVFETAKIYYSVALNLLTRFSLNACGVEAEMIPAFLLYSLL